MKVLRRHRRSRWLVPIAGVALAVPLCVSASGVATAGGQAKATAAAPLVDPDYLYGQLYSMATNYSYRISGADGDPRNPASPFNLPPTVNGWQELVAHWRDALTNSKADKKNPTPLADFATATDHYFRRTGGYQFDSDDAEVTLPGATCPGQRVLVAAHPDETPVPNDIVGLIDSGTTSGISGFGAARRHITLSNLGNEGAYDGLSGVALTLGEYKALLDWYDANKTYPERTLKVALLDARQKLREGSAYYAGNLIPAGPQGKYVLFANMDALGLDYPAYHLGTEFFWNNVTGGGVPRWFTFIKATPTAPNGAYRDTGAGSPGANIAANSAAIAQFRSDLQAAVLAGFAQQGEKYDFSVPLENPLRYNQTGQAPNPFVPTPMKPAYSAADQATYSPVRDDTDPVEDEQAFFNLGIPGFTVGGVKDSNTDENPYAASVNPGAKATPVVDYAGNSTTFQLGNGTPQAQGVSLTTLSAATAAGATNIKIASNAELAVGSIIAIDLGTNAEVRTITSIGTTGANGTGDNISPPLTLAHGSGSTVTLPDTALASAAAAGDANIKVASVAHLSPGRKILIDPGPNAEVRTVSSVGTDGPGGSGVDLNATLTAAHANGAPVSVLEGQPTGFLGDSIEHLNYFAGGAPHGVQGPGQPTEELVRALELPAQWTSLLLAGDDYLGATDRPKTPIAYFETDPVKPTSTLTVKFDAGFARDKHGDTKGLEYYWDFGDGTHAVGRSVSHTYSAPIYADVKLAVRKGGKWGVYRQAVAVDSPAGAAPATNSCGTFTPTESATLISDAKQALEGKGKDQ
jgi:hypothetical protein